MNIEKAISEPLVALIAFHNQFNRNIKFSFGALSALRANERIEQDGNGAHLTLPTGGEPWGKATSWQDANAMAASAEAFIAEIGIVRAASAFENYVTGALAEFDRANGDPNAVEAENSLGRLMTRLGCDRVGMEDPLEMCGFFDVARNCIVHRSGRASPELARRAASDELSRTLARWPKRAGKWKVGIPAVAAGEQISWQPRHSIMASDSYYRLAIIIDRRLVTVLGASGLVRMAAHWRLFADNRVEHRGKLNAHVMMRAVLSERYHVREEEPSEVIKLLRDIGIWDNIRRAFDVYYPPSPRDARARRRV